MATASLLLDKSRTLKGTDLHPVCIRITHLRKQWPVGMKMYASEKDYKKALDPTAKLNDRQKQLRDQLIEKRTKAQGVLDNLKVVTLQSFKQHFFAEIDLAVSVNNADITTQFNSYIQELKDDDHVGNAQFYESTLKAFLSYRGNVSLMEIDEEYLKRFVMYYTKLGNSRATAQGYLSKLRKIFNRAIKMGVISRKYYPFGMDGYSIGTSTQSKKALMPQQVKQFYEYKPKNDSQRRAKEMWFFSYLCHGINSMDILRLKWKNVSMTNGTITFVREKTKNSKSEQKTLVVYMHDEVKRIIQRYGNSKKGQNDYVFPILDGLVEEKDIFKKVIDWKRYTNRCINRMADKMGIDVQLNMSVARHSFGTALKLKGTPVAVISDCLGHASMKTTEHYLASIPDNMKRDITTNLLDFGRTQLKAV